MDMVNRYEPEIIWSDGDWDQPSSYWESTTFLAWLYNTSPVKDVVVVNDRWGNDCRGKNGGFYTPWDGYNPGHVQKHKWEDSATIGTSYGYNRHEDIAQFSTGTQLIQVFTEVVSTGGNMILGVGPMRDGNIPVIIEERLLQMGAWLSVYGEAIYATVPWRVQNDTIAELLWYTQGRNNTNVYAIFFEWPEDGILTMVHPIPMADATIYILGNYTVPLKWEFNAPTLSVVLPPWNLALQFGYLLQDVSVWALRMEDVQ